MGSVPIVIPIHCTENNCNYPHNDPLNLDGVKCVNVLDLRQRLLRKEMYFNNLDKKPTGRILGSD